jgi:TP901 family phage tail tape measure protein
MATAIHPVKIPISAIDNASNVINRITKGINQSFNKMAFKIPKMPTIPSFGKRIQSQIDNISFGRVLSTVTNGISTIKNKLSTLSIGNAPNLMEKSFKQAFKNIRGEVSKLQTVIEKAANVTLATQGMEQFGKSTLNALKSPIQTGMEFEHMMSAVSAVSLAGERAADESAKKAGLSSNTAGAALDMLTKKAASLAETTAWTGKEIAEGMSFLGMAGMKANDIAISMKGMADLASAGGSDLARTADIASNVATMFFGEQAASQMGRMADVFAHTMTSYNVDLSMLGETMKYAGPQFSSTGNSMESLAAAAGVLGNSGIQASTAGTGLRSILINLAKPTMAMGVSLEAMGVSVTKVVDGKEQLRDFPDIVRQIAKGTANMGTAEKLKHLATVAGKTAVGTLDVLVKNVDNYENAIARMGENGEKTLGTAESVAKERLNNLQGSLTLLGSVTDAFKTAIYDSVKAPLKVMADGIYEVMATMTDWVKNNQTLVAWIMKIGGAVGGGTIAIAVFLKAISSLNVVFSVLRVGMIAISGFAVPLLAIGAAGLLIYKNWQPIAAFFSGFWQGLTDSLAPVSAAFQPIISAVAPLATWFMALITPVDKSSESLQKFTNIGSLIGSVVGGSITLVADGIGWLIEKLGNLGSAIGTSLSGLSLGDIGNKIKESFANFSLTDVISRIKESFANFNLAESGMALLVTFADGVKQGASYLYEAVLSAFNYVWKLFTHSNADAGPFAQTKESGWALLVTFADGVKKGWNVLYNAVAGAFSYAWQVIAEFKNSLTSGNVNLTILGVKAMKSLGNGIIKAGGALTDGILAVLERAKNFAIEFLQNPFSAAIFFAMTDSFSGAIKNGFSKIKGQFSISFASLFGSTPSQSIISKRAWEIAKEMNGGFSQGSKQYLSPAFKEVWNQIKMPPLAHFTSFGSGIIQSISGGITAAIPVLMSSLRTTSFIAITMLKIALNSGSVVAALKKIVKVFGLWGVGIYFIVTFRKELLGIISNLRNLDFGAAFGGIADIFQKVLNGLTSAWVSWTSKLQGTPLGSIMQGITDKITSIKQAWLELSPHVQRVIGWFTAGLAAIGAALYKLPLQKIVMFMAFAGRAAVSISPIGKALLVVTGLVAKAFIIFKTYPEQVAQIFNFLSGVVSTVKSKIQELGKWITQFQAFSFLDGRFLESVFMFASFFLLPFPKIFKVLSVVMYAFDMLAIRMNYGTEAARKFSMVMGGVFSVIFLALTGNPILAALTGIVYALYTFKDEIAAILTSTFDFWKGVWDSFPASVKVGIGILAGLGIAVTAIATGFISIPMLIIGALSGGLVALASYKAELVEWWDGLAEVFQVGVMALGIAAVAGLAVVFMRIRKGMAAQAKAKLCAKNPMLACMLPPKKELVKRIKERKNGWALVGDAQSKSCMAGDCTKKTIAASKLSTAKQIEATRQATSKQMDLFNKQSQSQTQTARTGIKARTKLFIEGAKNRTNSIKNSFQSMFSWMGKQWQKAGAVAAKVMTTMDAGKAKYKDYIEKAKAAGTGDKSTAMKRGNQYARETYSKFDKATGAGSAKPLPGQKAFVSPKMANAAQSIGLTKGWADVNKKRTMMQKAALLGNMRVTEAMGKAWDRLTVGVGNGFSKINRGLSKVNQGVTKAGEKLKSSNLRSKLSFTNLFATIRTGAASATASLKAMRSPTPAAPLTGPMPQAAPKKGMSGGRKGAIIGVGAAIAAAGTMFSGGAEASQLDTMDGSVTKVTQSVSMMAQAVNMASSAWEWMKNNVDMLVTGGMLLLSTGLIDLGAMLSFIGPAIAVVGAGFVGWQVGLSLVSGKFFEITAVIGNFLNSTLGGLGTALMAIPNALGNVFLSIGTMIGQLVGAISMGNWSEIGMIVINGIVGGFSFAIGGLLTLGSGIVQTLWSGITGAVSILMSVGMFLVNMIRSAVMGAGGMLISAGASLINSIATGVRSSISLVTGAITSLMSQAKALVSNIDWADAGRKIITSITAGVKSAAKGLISSVKGVFTSVRNLSPFSEPKDASSPLYGLGKSGAAIPKMLGDGVKTGEKSLVDPFKLVLGNARKATDSMGLKIPTMPDLTKGLGDFAAGKLNQVISPITGMLGMEGIKGGGITGILDDMLGLKPAFAGMPDISPLTPDAPIKLPGQNTPTPTTPVSTGISPTQPTPQILPPQTPESGRGGNTFNISISLNITAEKAGDAINDAKATEFAEQVARIVQQRMQDDLRDGMMDF